MIKKFILAIIGIFYFAIPVMSFSDDELARMEYTRYGQAFENESLSTRLNRLESDVFGMAQSGSVDDRINMLAKLSQDSIKSPISPIYENYYPGDKPSKLKSMWNTISAPFSTTSTMTGFTPSWDSYYGTTGSGYANNMYRNEFLNFMNNPGNYCPYHNRYHNNNRFFNRPYYQNKGFLNSGIKRPYYHNNLHNHNYNGNYYNYYRNFNNNPYFTPDITTRSSVHIIRD